MADTPRQIWITGIGIVSCLGEGPQAHWDALGRAEPRPERLQRLGDAVVKPHAPARALALVEQFAHQRLGEHEAVGVV